MGLLRSRWAVASVPMDELKPNPDPSTRERFEAAHRREVCADALEAMADAVRHGKKVGNVAAVWAVVVTAGRASMRTRWIVSPGEERHLNRLAWIELQSEFFNGLTEADATLQADDGYGADWDELGLRVPPKLGGPAGGDEDEGEDVDGTALLAGLAGASLAAAIAPQGVKFEVGDEDDDDEAGSGSGPVTD